MRFSVTNINRRDRLMGSSREYRFSHCDWRMDFWGGVRRVAGGSLDACEWEFAEAGVLETGDPSTDFQGKWYRSSARQLRRLESIMPGPINAIYGETVAGTAVIRTFGLQSIFVTSEESSPPACRELMCRAAARAEYETHRVRL